ncbi:unnamed protein product [Urochloa humidicola]
MFLKGAQNHDEHRDHKSNFEFEDEKKTEMGSLRKKAIDASTKISNSLKKTWGKSGNVCDLKERKLLRHLGRFYFCVLLPAALQGMMTIK